MLKILIRLLLLKLILPIVGKYAAERAAGFLQARREERLRRATEIRSERSPECPPCPTITETVPVVNMANRVWFSLSGILLGGAAAMVGYLFVSDSQS